MGGKNRFRVGGTKTKKNSRFSFFFLNISRTNSKTSKVIHHYPTVCIKSLIFNHFPKNLDSTITFNSVTLKNTQTEPQKYIIFSMKQ